MEAEYLRVLVQLNAAGIITVHDFSQAYPEIDLPMVVVDRVGHHSTYGVFSNNEEGGRLAAEVVVKAGAKQVAVVSGPTTALNINHRFKASCAYLSEKGVAFRRFYSQTYDFEKIQAEAEAVLREFPEVDSIITPSDIHGMAYLRKLLALGKRVPEEVQVIVYDDTLMSQFTYPALSTIHQAAYAMGEEAAKMIYQLDQGVPVAQKQVELPVHYVKRETIRER